MVRKRIFLVLLTAMFVLPAAGFAADDPNDGAVAAGGLFGLPLEELMDMEVISVTRTKGQSVFTSPAAIYVITQEDIRRSGLQSIPELLRLAPGVQVSRIRADQWAISIRGVPGRFANKMLVQIDGRAVYSMLFSGVLWETLDLVLEDIERIEIIRGPGSSLWGPNAVHGIINIITKKVKDTQGGYFDGIGGNYDSIGSLRYGGKAGENGYWRAWGKQRYSNDFPTVNSDFTDDYGLTTMGFRYDWDDGDSDTYTLETGAFDGRFSTFFPVVDLSSSTMSNQDTELNQYGGNVRGRWEHEIDDTSSVSFQAYINMNTFSIPGNQIDFRMDWNLFDIDFQHNFEVNDDHAIVWGLEYQHDHFNSRGSERVSFVPSTRNFDLFSGFVQDSFPVFTEKLKGMAGVKLLDNTFTGFEYQPSARLAYHYDERQVFWTAYSRAIRIPSRANLDLLLNTIAPSSTLITTGTGNKDLVSGRVNSYEAGWRLLFSDKLSLDVTGYIMNSDNIVDVRSPVMQTNDITSNTEGIELAVDWQASESWRLKGTYSWFHTKVTRGSKNIEDNTPQNMFTINSYKNFSKEIELNTNIFFQDRINEDTDANIASWFRLDTGLVWHINKDTEFGIWGQNLTDNKHQEFTPSRFVNTGASEMPRSFFFQLTRSF